MSLRNLASPFPWGRGILVYNAYYHIKGSGKWIIETPSGFVGLGIELAYVTIEYFSQGTSIVSSMVHKTVLKQLTILSLTFIHRTIWKGFHHSVLSHMLKGTSLHSESLNGVSLPLSWTSHPNQLSERFIMQIMLASHCFCLFGLPHCYTATIIPVFRPWEDKLRLALPISPSACGTQDGLGICTNTSLIT